jgi:hypothetical protein
MKKLILGLGLVMGIVLGGCAEEVVGASEGGAVPCGSETCSDSEYCCDASCGLCVAEGLACTETCEGN